MCSDELPVWNSRGKGKNFMIKGNNRIGCFFESFFSDSVMNRNHSTNARVTEKHSTYFRVSRCHGVTVSNSFLKCQSGHYIEIYLYIVNDFRMWKQLWHFDTLTLWHHFRTHIFQNQRLKTFVLQLLQLLQLFFEGMGEVFDGQNRSRSFGQNRFLMRQGRKPIC